MLLRERRRATMRSVPEEYAVCASDLRNHAGRQRFLGGGACEDGTPRERLCSLCQKQPVEAAVEAESDSPLSLGRSPFACPDVAERRVILDPVECRIERLELATGALDGGSNVGPVAVLAAAGDEAVMA